MARWHCEHAAESKDLWLVRQEPLRLYVLAPPGVALCRRAEARHGTSTLPEGWRLATWERQGEDHWPAIDEDSPDRIRQIDTEAVLILVDDELHELIWSCLWSQLQIARRIGRQSPGLVPAEDLARSSAFSATWLRDELARAFPKRATLLEPGGWQSEWDLENRGDPAELILPLCQRNEHLKDRGDGHALRSIARWIQVKLSTTAPHTHAQDRHVWRAGETVDGTCQVTPDPSDHSDFGWDEPCSDTDWGSETEELLLS